MIPLRKCKVWSPNITDNQKTEQSKFTKLTQFMFVKTLYSTSRNTLKINTEWTSHGYKYAEMRRKSSPNCSNSSKMWDWSEKLLRCEKLLKLGYIRGHLRSALEITNGSGPEHNSCIWSPYEEIKRNNTPCTNVCLLSCFRALYGLLP